MNEKTKTYSDGIREAWDAAYRISMMSNEQKYNVFGVSPRDNIFEVFSAEHVIEALEIKDAARENHITKKMLEDFMYNHGICHPDLSAEVQGWIMLDIVNDIISELTRVGTLKDFLDQMNGR